MRGRLAVLLALALVPVGAAQVGITNPTDGSVTLHFHQDGFLDFAINTQPAQFGGRHIESLGLATSTLSCLPGVPNVGVTGEGSAWHTYYGFSTPGPVQYETESGRPMVHPVEGLGYNATLDAGVAPVLRWFLETTGSFGTGAPEPLVVVPNVIVEATLRGAESPRGDEAAYNTGPVIAQGRSAPALLAADASQGADHSMVDGRHIYGFTVPMEVQQAAIGDHGYHVRIDVFHDVPGCQSPDSGYVMTNLVTPFANAEHRPMVTTGILDPLRIVSLTPAFNGTDVIVRADVRSVWGAYDVDEGNLTLTIDGPSGSHRLEPSEVIQRKTEHYHLTEPVNITWVWERSDAPDGLYRLHFTAYNDQRTAVAQATAMVELGPDRAYAAEDGQQPGPPRELPAVPAALLGLAVAAVAIALRRRRA